MVLAVGCAGAGVGPPRLRVRAWLSVAEGTGRSHGVGGDIGLVMPLERAFDLGARAAGDGGPEEVAEVLGRDGTALSGSLAFAGRSAPCRVSIACRWEHVERARALARAGGEP